LKNIVITAMHPSTQSCWRQEEASPQEDGRLPDLQSLTSSSRIMRQSIILSSIPLHSPQNILFQNHKEGTSSRMMIVDVISQVLDIIEEDDDDPGMFFAPEQ
jgi:hypothetical protein